MIDESYFRLAAIWPRARAGWPWARTTRTWSPGSRARFRGGRDEFEVAMLYGIRSDEQRRLAREGYAVRTLIRPARIGTWFMRRIAEKPVANTLLALRNVMRIAGRLAMELRGAIAAAVTPLRDGGTALDEEAFAPLVGSSRPAGIDGLLAAARPARGAALGRRTAARDRAFVAARPGGFQVAIHAGAQTTADTVALAAHARRPEPTPSP